MPELREQPSKRTTRKMEAVGIGGAMATVMAWIAGQAGVEMPMEVAVAIAAIIVFVAGYWTTDRA